MGKSILIVDDERRLVALIEAYLKQEGFSTFAAYDGQEAIELALKEKIDLIILDIMMPKMNGYEFIHEYRKINDTPIILLTAKVDEDDKVMGLELGADDYVTKPFRPRELIARVHAVLRRTDKMNHSDGELRIGDISVVLGNHEVRVKDAIIQLTPTEFELLVVFMISPGRVFSRLDLLEKLQGIRYEGYQRTIDLHIKNLRSKIKDGHPPQYIQTIYGVGYKFTKDTM